MRPLIVALALLSNPAWAQTVPTQSFSDALGGIRAQALGFQASRRQALAIRVGQIAKDLVEAMVETQRMRCGIAELRIQTRQGGLRLRLAILHRTHELGVLHKRLHERMVDVTAFARVTDPSGPELAAAAEGLFVSCRHLLGQVSALNSEGIGLAADLESFGFRDEAKKISEQTAEMDRDARELDLQSKKMLELVQAAQPKS